MPKRVFYHGSIVQHRGFGWLQDETWHRPERIGSNIIVLDDGETLYFVRDQSFTILADAPDMPKVVGNGDAHLEN